MNYLEKRGREIAATIWLGGALLGALLVLLEQWTTYEPVYGPMYFYIGAVAGACGGFLCASSLNLVFGALLYVFGREARSRLSRVILAFSFGAGLLGFVLALVSMALAYHGGSGLYQGASPDANGAVLLHDSVVPTIWLALNLAVLVVYWRRSESQHRKA